MYCKNCGNEVKDTDKYCSNCGSSIRKKYNYARLKKIKIKYIVISILTLYVIVGVLKSILNDTNEDYTVGVDNTELNNVTEEDDYYDDEMSEDKSFDGNVLLTFENIYYIKNDGTIWGKGVNTDGELGNGQRTDSIEWTQVLDIYNAQKIFQYSYCYALTTDGDLYRWGNNIFRPEKVEFPYKIIDVTRNADQTSECPPIITCDNGKKYLLNYYKFVELDFENIDTISFAGKQTSLYYFLLLDGQLYKCEPNFQQNSGYLNDLEISDKTFTELYDITSIECENKKLKGGSSISTYDKDYTFTTYFIDEENGECFKCKFDDENSRLESCGGKRIKTDYVIHYSDGDKNSYSLFYSGDVVCSGDNKYGQLGDGTHESLKEGWELNDYNFMQLKVVGNSVAAIDENNNVWAWGRYFSDTPQIVISAEDFYLLQENEE